MNNVRKAYCRNLFSMYFLSSEHFYINTYRLLYIFAAFCAFIRQKSVFMKIKFIALTLLLLITKSSYLYSQDTENYFQSIRNERLQRNHVIANPESSPLSPEQVERFDSLSYFDINPEFRIMARLNKSTDQKSVSITMSDNSRRDFIRYGSVTFSIHSKEYKLDVFVNNNLPEFSDSGQLFIPFKDGTSGTSTSAYGRYITLYAPVEDNKVVIDFNKAYNLFSDYNDRVVTIVSPPDNILPLNMSVGQRKFEDRL